MESYLNVLRKPTMILRPLTLALVLLPAVTFAENWGSWRGPTQNGISTETGVPTEWSKEKNVAWRVALPGPAGATPVVWDDRVFLTSVDGDKLVLLCFSTKDGGELWRREISVGNKDVRGDEGNSASPSPITDGKHVWTFMASGPLACFTVDGEPVWDFDVQERYGKFRIAFGMSSTPVLHDGRLFLQLIHGDGKAATQEALVASVDAATGDPIWKTPRITGAEKENEHGYSSPMLYDFGGKQMLITHGADQNTTFTPKHSFCRKTHFLPHHTLFTAKHALCSKLHKERQKADQ